MGDLNLDALDLAGGEESTLTESRQPGHPAAQPGLDVPYALRSSLESGRQLAVVKLYMHQKLYDEAVDTALLMVFHLLIIIRVLQTV